jgi:hypothetical protein
MIEKGYVYNKFNIFDLFQSRVGIAAITSVLTFSALVTISPPFVQERPSNEIESPPTNYVVVYIMSVLVFFVMMLLPSGAKGSRI